MQDSLVSCDVRMDTSNALEAGVLTPGGAGAIMLCSVRYPSSQQVEVADASFREIITILTACVDMSNCCLARVVRGTSSA